MLNLKILLSYGLQIIIGLLLWFLWFVVLILLVCSVQNWLGMVGAAALLLVLLALVVHGCYQLVEDLDENRWDWRYTRDQRAFQIKKAEEARRSININPYLPGCTTCIDLGSDED